MRSVLARLGLASRLTILLGVVAALGTLVMGVYVSRSLEAQAVQRLEATLVTQARLLRDSLPPLLGGPTGDAALQEHARRVAAAVGARVTVIAPGGEVLLESQKESVAEMENHAGRPEVRAALAGGVGSDVRRSVSVGREFLYVAIPLDGPGGARGVLRLALPTSDVDGTRTLVRRTVAAGALLAFGLAVGVGLFVGRRVTRPVGEMRAAAQRMARGDFAATVPVVGTDEVAALGAALNQMSAALREKIEGLASEQAKGRAILDEMVEGVVALDDRGRVLVLNPAARAIFGVEEAEAAGRPFLEVIRQKVLLDLIDEVRTTGQAARRELELGHPVNRVVAARAGRLRLSPDAGGVLLVLHDVTDLRRLERVRREFVANVSHELRTPLTCIKGYLETLLDGALEEPAHARQFLEVASVHAERLGRLVDDLLELSNIESGRVVLTPASVDVGAVIGGVATMFEREAARKRQTLERAGPPGLLAHADRDRLVQILVNLVDNAVKFTPDGGRVRIEARPLDADRIEVSVSDTGVGIPSTDLPRITERFYRVDKTRSRELGGTGLGLAIVKHLVQAHGGELAIDSAVGRGTTVRFTLPGAPRGAS